jgi:hypothetical protein
MLLLPNGAGASSARPRRSPAAGAQRLENRLVGSDDPGELPQLRELLERVIRHGQGSTITLTCRTKSGDFLPAEMALHAFESGGRVLILGLVHDRSEHRQRDPGD